MKFTKRIAFFFICSLSLVIASEIKTHTDFKGQTIDGPSFNLTPPDASIEEEENDIQPPLVPLTAPYLAFDYEYDIEYDGDDEENEFSDYEYLIRSDFSFFYVFL